jgi:hypothetical protein
VVLLLSTDSLFCGYLVFLSVFFFAIDLVSAELSTHVSEYQEEEEEAEMAMVWAVWDSRSYSVAAGATLDSFQVLCFPKTSSVQ